MPALFLKLLYFLPKAWPMIYEGIKWSIGYNLANLAFEQIKEWRKNRKS